MAEGKKYIVQLVDRYTAPMKRISKSTREFSKRIISAKTAMTLFGGALTMVALGRPLLQYQKAMNRVKAVSKATADEMAKLDKMALHLGKTTSFTSIQVAKGMEELASSGQTVKEILTLIKPTLHLAAAGGIELREAADSATDIMQQFGKEAEDFDYMVDVMASASINASTKLDQLVAALRNSGNFAKMANISFEETTAMLMGIAESGIKGGAAGTFFSNMLKQLVKPTRKARLILRRFGVDLRKFVEKGEITDAFGLLEEIKEKNVHLGVLFEAFAMQGSKAAAALVNVMPKVRGFYAILKAAGGEGPRIAEVMLEGLPKMVAEFNSALETLSLITSRKLLPTWEKFFNLATGTMRWLTTESGQDLIVLATSVMLFGAAIFAFLAPLAALILLVQVLITPVGLVISGIVASISLLVANLFWFRKYWGDVKTGLSDFFVRGIIPSREATQKYYQGRLEIFADKSLNAKFTESGNLGSNMDIIYNYHGFGG